MTQDNPSSGHKLASFYRKHPVVCHIVFMCIAFLIIGWGTMIFLDIWTAHGDTTIVPTVVNTSTQYAEAQLRADGFTVEVSDSVYDEKYPPGTVISTWPRGGATVKSGREIYLTIASYEPRKVTISMPLTNVSSRQALKYLESLDIKNVRIVNVPSQYADLALGAKYKGKELSMGQQIPINAEVVLEVGTVPNFPEVDVDAERDSSIDRYSDDDTFSTSAAYD